MRPLIRATLFLLGLALGSCRPKTPTQPVDHSDYRDHTQTKISSVDEFLTISEGETRKEVKFIITDFSHPKDRQILYLDSQFYHLHDEWYWFRLLNGQSIPGLKEKPEVGLHFVSIQEVYDWAKKHRLPLDLTWTQDKRLYSEGFYPDCFGNRRFYGIGSLLYLPAQKEKDGVWAFQLEFTDNLKEEDLEVFFAQLKSSLPIEIAEKLQWVVRSPFQEKLAKAIEREEHSFKIARLSDLEMAKAAEVYNEGLTAGYLRLWKTRAPKLGETKADDLLVLQYTPDFLPTAAGMITLAPQTPLAHLNLLAKNRQIPNAYVGDAFQTDEYKLSSRANQPVILQAIAPNQLKLVSITETQLKEWKAFKQKKKLSLEKKSVEDAPLLYSIDTLALGTLEEVRAQIGGKAAGFVLLASQREIEIPPNAMVLTTKAYEEHLKSFDEVIKIFLEDKDFNDDPKIRFLVLEGKKKFLALYPAQRTMMHRFLRHHRKDALKELIEEGGLTKAIRKKKINPKTLQDITSQLEAQFAALSPEQGLRFRSSSTVEDIEGFNGAGLYLSSSGFLYPEKQSKEKEKKKSIEKAIKEVWASYWSFEATEERQQEAIDHRSGAMAVVIHPRFEDEAELSNGVLTFSVLPDGKSSMSINVQKGAQSVTNPDSRDLPEQDVVMQQNESTPSITRRKKSTLSTEYILNDEQLLSLFSQAQLATMALLEKINKTLNEEQKQTTLTLDIEFRQVKEGWPKLASGEVQASRLIIKQARSLEPEARGLPEWLYQEAIPRSVLARARKIEEFTCKDKEVSVQLLSLYTDPGREPDFGYAQSPLTVWLKITHAGKEVTLLAKNFTSVERPILQGDGAWSLRSIVNNATAQETNISQLNIDKEKYSLWLTSGEQLQGNFTCEAETVFTTPTSYLLDLIRAGK